VLQWGSNAETETPDPDGIHLLDICVQQCENNQKKLTISAQTQGLKMAVINNNRGNQ
jgi:hypothetical protein